MKVLVSMAMTWPWWRAWCRRARAGQGEARARLRAKIADLEEAFYGSRFGDHHAFLLAKMLARVDAIDADLADVDARIDAEIRRQVAPMVQAVARLDG